MIAHDQSWPEGLDPDTICFTADVEWACDEVLRDLVDLFEAHAVTATFFVTHDGVEVPGHERGLHPNFRRNGDSYRILAAQKDEAALTDTDVQHHVVERTLSFAPEAKGLRAHSLHYDSTLLPIYQELGLEYDCSYQMPLVERLRPFWRQNDIVGLPTYFADHFDIISGATGFELNGLLLDRPGLKVLDFHPNIIYVNARDNDEYMATKSAYHDPERLLKQRWTGRGCRTLLIDLLEEVAKKNLTTATVGQVNAAWRDVAKWT